MRDMIRTAEPADQEKVEEVVRAAYQPWADALGIRPMPMDADYAALIGQGRVHLTGPAEIDGLIVLVPEDEALLVENVAVRPDLHGRGIGRRLLAFAEDEARRLGLPAVRLYTNARMTRNIALYTALGYTETGRHTLHVGEVVLMRKPLRLG
jgi:ribosomal protein S18 acetylase RimI-like enzyme